MLSDINTYRCNSRGRNNTFNNIDLTDLLCSEIPLPFVVFMTCPVVHCYLSMWIYPLQAACAGGTNLKLYWTRSLSFQVWVIPTCNNKEFCFSCKVDQLLWIFPSAVCDVVKSEHVFPPMETGQRRLAALLPNRSAGWETFSSKWAWS